MRTRCTLIASRTAVHALLGALRVCLLSHSLNHQLTDQFPPTSGLEAIASSGIASGKSGMLPAFHLLLTLHNEKEIVIESGN